MTTNPNELVIASRTYLWLGNPGATAPVDPSVDPGTGWKNAGHTTPDALSFSTSPEFQEVMSAQSHLPILRFKSSESITVGVQLLQWNALNFEAAYGGGEVSMVSSGVYKFTPPLLGEEQEKAVIIQTIYGTKRYLFIFPRAQQTEGVQLDLQRGQEARLPLSYSIQGGDITDPWYLLTNDPAFAPPA